MTQSLTEHHWSGWPGAWCFHCGIDDELEYSENALANIEIMPCNGPFGKDAKYAYPGGCRQCK